MVEVEVRAGGVFSCSALRMLENLLLEDMVFDSF